MQDRKWKSLAVSSFFIAGLQSRADSDKAIISTIPI